MAVALLSAKFRGFGCVVTVDCVREPGPAGQSARRKNRHGLGGFELRRALKFLCTALVISRCHCRHCHCPDPSDWSVTATLSALLSKSDHSRDDCGNRGASQCRLWRTVLRRAGNDENLLRHVSLSSIFGRCIELTSGGSCQQVSLISS